MSVTAPISLPPPRWPVSRLLFSACLLTSPAPAQPASPLWPPSPSLAHNSHNILSLIFTSASSLNTKYAWLGCKYFERVCSILILIQSHYSRQAAIHYEMRNRMKYGIRYTGSQQRGCGNNS